MICLLRAGSAGVKHIVVENDEDVELILPGKRIYAQIKMRSSQLISSDINGALERFDTIRLEHIGDRRSGNAEFAIVSNSPPGSELARAESEAWPADVSLIWPEHAHGHVVLPPPWPSVSHGFAACRTARRSTLHNLGTRDAGLEACRTHHGRSRRHRAIL